MEKKSERQRVKKERTVKAISMARLPRSVLIVPGCLATGESVTRRKIAQWLKWMDLRGQGEKNEILEKK